MYIPWKQKINYATAKICAYFFLLRVSRPNLKKFQKLIIVLILPPKLDFAEKRIIMKIKKFKNINIILSFQHTFITRRTGRNRRRIPFARRPSGVNRWENWDRSCLILLLLEVTLGFREACFGSFLNDKNKKQFINIHFMGKVCNFDLLYGNYSDFAHFFSKQCISRHNVKTKNNIFGSRFS